MIQFIAFTLAAATPVAEPAAPQDFLTPHLESQRYDNLRRHQQRQTQRNRERRSPAPASGISMAERQSAWNANKSEYRRRMLRDGPASADRWLDSVVIAGRE